MYRLVIILLCLLATPAIAKKSYPPYPEVWGYDILDDFDQSSVLSFEIGGMKNGDYTLYYPSIPRRNNDKSYNALVHVFEGVKKKFKDTQELNAYSKQQGGGSPRYIMRSIMLKDKSIIDVAANYKASGYALNSLHCLYIRRIDSYENKNEDYRLSPIGIAKVCKDGECKNKAYFLAPKLMLLKDDTFFAFDPDYYLFIRFDQDFKTKFKPKRVVKLDDNRELKSNFYVLPYSKVEYFFDHIAKGYMGEYTDNINKQFLDYLYQEEQQGGF